MLQYHFPLSLSYVISDHDMNIIIKIIAPHLKLRNINHIQFSIDYIKTLVSLFNVTNVYALAQININWRLITCVYKKSQRLSSARTKGWLFCLIGKVEGNRFVTKSINFYYFPSTVFHDLLLKWNSSSICQVIKRTCQPPLYQKTVKLCCCSWY